MYDWYDVHDNTSVAGPDREPEHYREFVISLPPIGPDDHVVDVGAGTGKLSGLVADAYPDLGRLTLIEPAAGGTRPIKDYDVRLYTCAELTAMLERHGLRRVQVWGGADGSEFSAESRRLVVLAEKSR